MAESIPSNELEEKSPLEANPYRELVENFIDDAPHYNANQLMHSLDEHMIESMLTDAKEAKFPFERTNPDTGLKQLGFYSPNDILSQFELALQALDTAPNDPTWKKFVPRANGLRTAVDTVMQNRRLAEPFRLAVFKRQADMLKQKDLGTEANGQESPELKAFHDEVAEDLGEEGVESSGVSLFGVEQAQGIITGVPKSLRSVSEAPKSVEH